MLLLKSIYLRGRFMKNKQIAHIVGLLILVISLSGCSEYNKILKSNDYPLKYEKAKEYYNNGDCYKALPLFEELMTFYRLTDKGEDVYYYYANTQYCLKEYYLASYYFKRFTKNYPNSSRAEECGFNAAVCSMKASPEWYLDQSDTYDAIDEFQIFMNRYPNSGLVDSCNNMIKGLRGKLERKSFEQAKLYFKMSKYRSAVISFNTTLEQFPDTDYREEILFLIVKANFSFAMNSVDAKKQERFEDTIDSYHTFVDSFGQSTYVNQAERFYNSSVKELNNIKEG